MEIRDEDVIYTADGVMPSTTFEVSDLKSKVRKQLNQSQQKLIEGIDCRYLSAEGGGWKRGKLRLRIELRLDFTPRATPPDEQS